jgi:hypothetical protein
MIPGSIMARLQMIKGLDAGWDSYNALPISSVVIERTRAFLRQVYEFGEAEVPSPFMAPGSDGSIGFEWEVGEKELLTTVHETGPVTFLTVEGEREREGELGGGTSIGPLILWLGTESNGNS